MLVFREFPKKFWLPMILAGTLTLGAVAQDNIAGDGILLHGKNLVLFAHESTCAAEGQIAAAQVFVSVDDGKTWQKRGPRIEGSAFEYVLDDGETLRIAGTHTAEGPGTNPFLLMSTADLFQWNLRRIYTGTSELRSLALSNKGQLIAWVKHLDPHLREEEEVPGDRRDVFL